MIGSRLSISPSSDCLVGSNWLGSGQPRVTVLMSATQRHPGILRRNDVVPAKNRGRFPSAHSKDDRLGCAAADCVPCEGPSEVMKKTQLDYERNEIDEIAVSSQRSRGVRFLARGIKRQLASS